MGFDFWVLPEGFVVHLAHGKSEARRSLKGEVKAAVGKVYNQALGEMRERFSRKE
jgi:hypothetical protein